LNICFAVPGLYAHPKIIEHLIADCNFDKKLFMSHTDHVRNVIIWKTTHKDEGIFPMYFECAQCGEVKEWNQFLGVTSEYEIKCRHCGRFN